MEKTMIHPETGEILHRDIHEVEYEYKGEKIKVMQPAWYNDKGDDWILNRTDWKIADQACALVKAIYEAKMRENNFGVTNVAVA